MAYIDTTWGEFATDLEFSVYIRLGTEKVIKENLVRNGRKINLCQWIGIGLLSLFSLQVWVSSEKKSVMM